MKVVLDTNVFISGIFFSGPPYQILKAWREDRFQLIVTHEILIEYRRVGEFIEKEHPQIIFSPILAFVNQNAILVDPPSMTETVCEDPDDDKFLACALSSPQAVIESGDKHLLEVSGYREIETLKPREFMIKYLTR